MELSGGLELVDLALIMPVYNEEACIANVLDSWNAILNGLNIDFRIIIVNDGSTDGTKGVLNGFAGNDRFVVLHKENEGHGPAILTGYKYAVGLARWVFQCDSDDEMKAEHFPAMWAKRNAYDAIFGFRTGRSQGFARKLMSICSRITVRMLYGRGIEDVNVPYRLIRGDILRSIIRKIPDDTFAPNLIVAGELVRAGNRAHNIPVPYECRKTGSTTIVKWRLLRAAITSFIQTLLNRLRAPEKPIR